MNSFSSAAEGRWSVQAPLPSAMTCPSLMRSIANLEAISLSSMPPFVFARTSLIALTQTKSPISATQLDLVMTDAIRRNRNVCFAEEKWQHDSPQRAVDQFWIRPRRVLPIRHQIAIPDWTNRLLPGCCRIVEHLCQTPNLQA